MIKQIDKYWENLFADPIIYLTRWASIVYKQFKRAWSLKYF